MQLLNVYTYFVKTVIKQYQKEKVKGCDINFLTEEISDTWVHLKPQKSDSYVFAETSLYYNYHPENVGFSKLLRFHSLLLEVEEEVAA